MSPKRQVPAMRTGKQNLPALPARMRLRRVMTSERDAAIQAELRKRPFAGSMTTEEERRLASEVPKIIDEIRLRRSRRFRRAPRGRLWMKRAIRENLATGGVPFRIPRQAQRLKRPRVVLVVDVSWSVARAAGLFLTMALEFLKSSRRVSVYFFVDRPVEATSALDVWIRGRRAGASMEHNIPIAIGGFRGLPRPASRAAGVHPAKRRSAASFAHVVGSLEGIDPNAPSDYGRAFYGLASGPLRALGRDSVLVLLGDGRTNRFDPLPWAFEEIAGRARRVLWLVPEARSRWGTGDSVLPLYLPFCDVAVETTDLQGLAHGVRELLASL